MRQATVLTGSPWRSRPVPLELFGHLTGAINDYDAYFDQVARRLAVAD